MLSLKQDRTGGPRVCMREGLQRGRGLKAHQRSCQTHKSLANNCNTDASPSENTTHTCITPSSETTSKAQPNETAEAKPGLKLPKSQERWNEANMYFHSIFSLSAQINNLDDFVQDVQQKVCDYFANTYGTIDIPDSEFQNKYLNISAKTLKRTLKQLKDKRADIEEIKFVSKLIRSKISKGCPRNDQDLQTELEIKFRKNFWQTCKSIFNTAFTSSLPAFTKNQCVQYFLQVLSQALLKA